MFNPCTAHQLQKDGQRALTLRRNFSVPLHLSLYEYEIHCLESPLKTIVPLPEARRNRPVPPVTVNDIVKRVRFWCKVSQGILKSVLLTFAVMLSLGTCMLVSVAEPVASGPPQYQVNLICSLLECKNFAFPLPL
jgi:hypothetical protein